MQKVKIILLLFILGLVITPWKLIDFCAAHPLGHEHHHHHDGPSPCELRKMHKGNEPALFPPMECLKFIVDVEAYDSPQQIQIKPAYETLAVLSSLCKLINVSLPEIPLIRESNPQCNSGPPLESFSLRGPPIL